MKKIFSIVALSAFVLTGCVKFAADEAVVLDTTSAPAIEVTSVGDYAIAATVTPAQNTSYYAYAIFEGGAKELSASTLLSNGYKKSAIVSGVVNAADKASIDIEALELTPNAEYTVYAAATTAMGANTEVASVTRVTTDKTIPSIAGVDSEVEGSEMTIWVGFNEPVALTGEGKVTASFYGINQEDFSAPLKTVEIPAENLVVDDDTWLGVAVPEEEAQPGAFVFVTFTEGLVVNEVGLKNAAYSNIAIDEEGPSKGICEQYDTKEWGFRLVVLDMMTGELTELTEQASFGDWKNFAYMVAPEEGVEAVKANDENVQVTYSQANGRTVNYIYDTNTYCPLVNPYGYPFMWNLLTEAPEFGASISIGIEAEAYEDVWGNPNAEFLAEDAFFCSYGFTLDDVLGTYVTDGESIYTGYDEEPAPFVIAASDDESKGNVMLTKAFGFDGIKLYGTFDGDMGLLSFEPSIYGEPQAVVDLEGVWADVYIGGYYSFYQEYETTVDFQMVASGVFSKCSDFFGYYYEVFSDPEVRSNDTFITSDYNYFKNVPVKGAEVAVASSASRTFRRDGRVNGMKK